MKLRFWTFIRNISQRASHYLLKAGDWMQTKACHIQDGYIDHLTDTPLSEVPLRPR